MSTESLQERAARLLGDGPYYDANRDVIRQGEHYTRHVMAMTGERLHSKADIAQELAHRDQLIEAQAAEIERLRERDDKRTGTISEALCQTVEEQKREIERLRAENFTLAAGACPMGFGDQGGTPRCCAEAEIERLSARVCELEPRDPLASKCHATALDELAQFDHENLREPATGREG